MAKRILTIGAGLGSLSAALRLAKLGFEVTLFEKNPEIGGKLHEKKLGTYRFDAGPSLLTMPFVIDELFALLGFRREDFLDFTPIEPICRYFYPDGARLDASADVEKTQREMAKLSSMPVK